MAVLMAVVLPFAGLVAAICCVWGYGFTWVELGLLVGMYTITGFGVTVGFHRLFAHRSFETIRLFKIALALAGSMSVQGPLLKWVAVHRRHHQYSDEAEDPHSPHRFGSGVRGVLAGFWHAHVGWMFQAEHPGLSRYVRDLAADRLWSGISRWFGLWVLLGLFIPTLLGGLLTGTWMGALLGLLWGGLARIFLVHHITWSINSGGSRPATRAGTISCSACWVSARAGTTTTTPSPPRPGTASGGGNWTSAICSSAS